MSVEKTKKPFAFILDKIDGDQFAEEAAKEIISSLQSQGTTISDGWHIVSEETPEFGIEVICFNKNWISEDFNQKGQRIGFINGDDEFTTAHWWDYQDCYMTISKSECDGEEFSDEIKNNTEPTHWHYMPNSPLTP